ncbi:MAG TPA: GNAT family N-acetyltransferase [Fimbriimonas sp.]
MIDIRSIRESEAEGYLHFLCDVFGLDFQRAYDVFFTEPYYDLNRKWALFEANEMVSILTTTPLEFGWGRAIGIAGVATHPKRRSEGYATTLMRRVLKEHEKRGEGRALLFARDARVYDRIGFETLDRVLRGPVRLRPEEAADTVEPADVKALYNEWAKGHPDRLRRDELRWQYWNWHYRTCTYFQGGYLCHEVGSLREAIFETPQEALPLPTGTEWFGTAFMTDQLGIPVHDAKVELYLMGYNVPGLPQMFMTDQF